MPTYFVRANPSVIEKIRNPKDSIRVVEAVDIFDAFEIAAEIFGVDSGDVSAWSHPHDLDCGLKVGADGMIRWQGSNYLFFSQITDLIGS